MRPPRIHFSGAVFHVMSRGNAGQRVFMDDSDRQMFMRAIAYSKATRPFKLFAYCLMSNHFHLLIQVDRWSTAEIMQQLLTRHAKHLNCRRRMIGHAFQARYKAIHCSTDRYLLTVIRYIHRNPVLAGMVDSIEKWKWSSHGEYMGSAGESIADIAFPLSVLNADEVSARRLYRDFVMGGDGDSPSYGLPAPFSPRRDTQETGRPIEELVTELAASTGYSVELLCGGGKRAGLVSARHRIVLRALEQGYRPSEIARFLNCSRARISQIARNLT